MKAGARVAAQDPQNALYAVVWLGVFDNTLNSIRVRRPVQHQLRPVAATEALSQLSCLKSSFFYKVSPRVGGWDAIPRIPRCGFTRAPVVRKLLSCFLLVFIHTYSHFFVLTLFAKKLNRSAIYHFRPFQVHERF